MVVVAHVRTVHALVGEVLRGVAPAKRSKGMNLSCTYRKVCVWSLSPWDNIRELLGEFIGEGHVIRLELLGVGGLGVGQHDGAEALARGRVGAVVDAGDAGTERDREGGLDVREVHAVEHDGL